MHMSLVLDWSVTELGIEKPEAEFTTGVSGRTSTEILCRAQFSSPAYPCEMTILEVNEKKLRSRLPTSFTGEWGG